MQQKPISHRPSTLVTLEQPLKERLEHFQQEVASYIGAHRDTFYMFTAKLRDAAASRQAVGGTDALFASRRRRIFSAMDILDELAQGKTRPSLLSNIKQQALAEFPTVLGLVCPENPGYAVVLNDFMSDVERGKVMSAIDDYTKRYDIPTKANRLANAEINEAFANVGSPLSITPWR